MAKKVRKDLGQLINEQRELARELRDKKVAAREGKKERYRLLSTKEKIAKVIDKGGAVASGTVSNLRKGASKKAIAARQRSATGLLSGVLGVKTGKTTYSGAGRPRGTFKYGMPIQQYKKLQAERRALFKEYQARQQQMYSSKGYSPEELDRYQAEQEVMEQELSQPINQQVAMQNQMPQQKTQASGFKGYIQRIEQKRKESRLAPRVPRSVADEELSFQEFVADNTISPNTQAMLDRLRRIQNKGQSDDIEMQRRLRERRLVAQAGNLLATPFIFNRHNMNFTDVDNENILMAPSVFKEIPENNILRPRGVNITQTSQAGNSLDFFSDQMAEKRFEPSANVFSQENSRRNQLQFF